MCVLVLVVHLYLDVVVLLLMSWCNVILLVMIA
jgi:hypothetical protein